ncbi:hypothetical protein TNCV_138371 [Trichonephila clavipes]|nr:hypothetical protein TNCV_138371 [Trichonephila clavipes]
MVQLAKSGFGTPIRKKDSSTERVKPTELMTASALASSEKCSGERNTVSFSKRIDQERISTLSKKIAQGNLTASCKRLISWFLIFKASELGRKIFPVRPPKF